MCRKDSTERERRNDAIPDAKLHDLIKMADVIMPWFVGRYGKSDYSNFHNLIQQDIAWCKENNVAYAPLCFPGSSDRNMHPNNSINPRYGGQFLWDQMYFCIKSGAQMLYIAMFDEIDEGTAIFKCTDTPPVTKISQFIGMDGKPSDHYLWLTGKATQMLRKEIPLTKKMPERN